MPEGLIQWGAFRSMPRKIPAFCGNLHPAQDTTDICHISENPGAISPIALQQETLFEAQGQSDRLGYRDTRTSMRRLALFHYGNAAVDATTRGLTDVRSCDTTTSSTTHAYLGRNVQYYEKLGTAWSTNSKVGSLNR
jgi:hypothetical protein